MTINELIQYIINHQAQEMSLSKSYLEDKTGAELAQAFAAIPASVTTLNLSNNDLGGKTDDALAQAFAAIPASVKTLNLSNTNFWKKTGDALAHVLATIPASVTTLNLSTNYLSGDKLAQTLAGIPGSVTTLDLASNYLDSITDPQLAQIFAAIPASVTTLNLSDNNFGAKTNTAWAQIFAAIPASVRTLNLSSNYLGKCPELLQALAAIPASVTTLNLSDNSLGNKTGAELAEILAAIPSHIKIEGNLGISSEQIRQCLECLLLTVPAKAKTEPENQLLLLKRVLIALETQPKFNHPDVLAIYNHTNTAILMMEGLVRAKTAETSLHTGSQFSSPKSNALSSYRLDLVLQTFYSVAQKFSTVKSDEPLFAMAQEATLDLAHQLYYRIPKNQENESPAAKVKRLEVCKKILTLDFIQRENKNNNIIDPRDSLQHRIESEQALLVSLKDTAPRNPGPQN